MSSIDLQDALADLSIPNVARRYLDTPMDVNPGDCPAQWVGQATRTQEPLTFTVYDPTYECSVYWAVAPIVQGDKGRREARAAVGALVDNIYSEMNTRPITGFMVTAFSVTPEPIDINGTLFDGVVMTVTAKGK